jgi:hypothetical protein
MVERRNVGEGNVTSSIAASSVRTDTIPFSYYSPLHFKITKKKKLNLHLSSLKIIMEDVFVHSRPIDATETSKTRSFTTLPIRIHKRNDIADAASKRLLKDWGRHMDDGQEKKSLTSISELGNLCAFAYSEVLPERLGILTYITDLGLMHDGMQLSPQCFSS